MTEASKIGNVSGATKTPKVGASETNKKNLDVAQPQPKNEADSNIETNGVLKVNSNITDKNKDESPAHKAEANVVRKVIEKSETEKDITEVEDLNKSVADEVMNDQSNDTDLNKDESSAPKTDTDDVHKIKDRQDVDKNKIEVEDLNKIIGDDVTKAKDEPIDDPQLIKKDRFKIISAMSY